MIWSHIYRIVSIVFCELSIIISRSDWAGKRTRQEHASLCHVYTIQLVFMKTESNSFAFAIKIDINL